MMTILVMVVMLMLVMLIKGCPCAVGVGKVKAISPYRGTPAPPNGMPCLQFEANTTITLLSDEDNTWWQVRNSLSMKNFIRTQHCLQF